MCAALAAGCPASAADTWLGLGPVGGGSLLVDRPGDLASSPDGGGPGAAGGPAGGPLSVGGGGAINPTPGLAVQVAPRYRLAQLWDLPASAVAGAPSLRAEDGRFLVADPVANRVWGVAADGGASQLLAGDDAGASGMVDVQLIAKLARLDQPLGAEHQSLTGLAYLPERGHDRIRILSLAGNLLPFAGQGSRPLAVGEPVASVSLDAPGALALDPQGGGVNCLEGTGQVWAWGPNRRVVGVQVLSPPPTCLAADPASSGAWAGQGRKVLALRWPSALPALLWEAPGELLGLAHDGQSSLYALARLGPSGLAAGVWLLELGQGGTSLLRRPTRVAGLAGATEEASASGVGPWLGQDADQVPLWPVQGSALGIDLRQVASPTELAGDLWLYAHRGPVASRRFELVRLQVVQ